MAHGLRRGNYRDHNNYLWVLVNMLQLDNCTSLQVQIRVFLKFITEAAI